MKDNSINSPSGNGVMGITECQDSKSKVAYSQQVCHSLTEKELIIIKGLLALNYDDAFILNFVNGIGPQVSEPVDKKKERVSFSSDDKQNWKDALGKACREIEAAKSMAELAEVNNRHSKRFGKSDVYKRVLEEACRKFPSAQRYG